MSKEYFDLILFAPLDVELEAVFESFPHLERRTSEDILKYTIDLGVERLTGLVAQPPEWGNQEALKTAQHLLENYEAGVVVCLGIAGALSRDLRLGDVCYSGTIFDVHERLKVKDSKNRRSKSVILEHNPKHFVTPKRITVALNHLRADPVLRSKFYEGWRQEQATYLDALLKRELYALLPHAEFGLGRHSLEHRGRDLLHHWRLWAHKYTGSFAGGCSAFTDSGQSRQWCGIELNASEFQGISNCSRCWRCLTFWVRDDQSE